MPDQPISGCEGPIGLEPLAVPVDLTGGEPLSPHLGSGVAVPTGVKGTDPLARIPRGHAVAVGMAPVEPGRQLSPQDESIHQAVLEGVAHQLGTAGGAGFDE